MEIPVYIFFFTRPTVDREIKDIHNNNYPTLHRGSKEPKSAIQKKKKKKSL